MHPGDYLRPQRCGCKRERFVLAAADKLGLFRPQTWRGDKYRTDGREQRGKTCGCDGYSFPHFRGRGYCNENTRLTAEDLRERYESGCWA